MKNSSKRKPEFSKVIFACAAALTAVVTIFTFAAVWKTGDLSPLAYLIPAVFGELATATGFYYWKARNENRAKYTQEFVKSFAETYGIEAAIQLAETVLKE